MDNIEICQVAKAINELKHNRFLAAIERRQTKWAKREKKGEFWLVICVLGTIHKYVQMSVQ